MQVYKAYFKIIKKNFLSLLIYFVIFLVISWIISSALTGYTSAAFNETRSNIAIINDDGASPLTDGLVDYLAANAHMISLKDSTEDLQDALFYGNVAYVLRIPKGFTQSFLSGDTVRLERTVSAPSAEAANIDLMVNKYLHLSELYIKNIPGIPASEAAQNVLHDLKITSKVDYDADFKQQTTINLSYYFQLIAYSLLAILITGITVVMMSFNEEHFSKRNQCSPVSLVKMNLQMVLANATFAMMVWGAMCAAVFLMYGRFMFSTGILLLCVNALAFTIASLGIGFLAGKFVKDHVVQAAVTNVVSLGMSFISGVFVSQELLGKSVLAMASFTPGYWYVKAVEDIRSITIYSGSNLLPILYSLLIQLGFAAAFIIIALVIAKQRTSTSG